MPALRHKHDFYAGGLMMLFGLFMALNGPSYRLGTLMHMGPGLMPTVLGVILTFLSILIAATAIASPDWWGWFCILAGPPSSSSFAEAMEVLFPQLSPASSSPHWVIALTTWEEALVLAAVVTALGVSVFSSLLQVPMPLLAWTG